MVVEIYGDGIKLGSTDIQNPPHRSKHTKDEGRIAEAMNYDIIRDGKNTDIVIVVMGTTGAGKSTFLNRALGRDFVNVNHNLVSGTHPPFPVVIDPFVLGIETLQNYRVVLLDTPGFDDTFRDDMTILKEIVGWLAQSYRKKTTLGGVLYLHDVTAARLTGSARKNLEMFSLMCGDAAMNKTVLVTTKCDLVSSETLERRDAEMRSIFWNTMTKSGAKVLRFHGESESARNILQDILRRKTLLDDGNLQIQTELVDKGMRFGKTQVGKKVKKTMKQAARLFKYLLGS